MSNRTKQTGFLSLSQLARVLDLPYPRISRAVRTKTIAPDGVIGGRVFVFKSDRIDSIRQLLAVPAEVLS